MLKKAFIYVFPALLMFYSTSRAEPVSLVESDYQVAIYSGVSFISGGKVQFADGAIDFGYRAYPKDFFEHFTVDLYGGYFMATTTDNLLVGYGGIRYYMNESNDGLVIGGFAGYGSRTSVSGLALSGTAGYHFRIADQWSVGAEGAVHYMSVNKVSLFTGMAALLYWF